MPLRPIKTLRAVISIACIFMNKWIRNVQQRHKIAGCNLAVLRAIAANCCPRTWTGFHQSIDWLRKETGYSRSAVEKSLAFLRKNHLIKQDGEVPVPFGRPVVKYRLSGTPECPLPEDVVMAREAAYEDQQAVAPEWEPVDVSAGQRVITYTTTKATRTDPIDVPVAPLVSENQDPSRSVVDESSRSVTRASAERANHHIIPAPVAARLTPIQQRRLLDIANETRVRDGVGPNRIAARIRRWWTITTGPIRSAFGWAWHAIEARPYGCSDPRCEDGQIWDGDRVTGRCAGCTERRRDRAAAVRSGNGPTAPLTARWRPAWVSDRTDARAAFTALLGPVAVPG